MSLTLGIIASSRGNIVPPLDTFGGAAAAYSTRLLSSAYGGSAVRVRRSFDNAEQDIGFSGGAINETALMNFVGYQNLVQRSEEFENAIWGKYDATISSNSTTAPNGTLTADTLIENATNNFHQLGVASGVTTIDGQTYTFSFYAKQASGNRYLGVAPVGTGGNNQRAVFDLINGVFLGNSSVATPTGQPFSSSNTSIQSVGNGWYRCSVTVTVIGTIFYPTFTLMNGFSNNTSTGLVYAGDGSSGVYIWGAQLNVGTTAQPYQVTTSAARSGDGFVTKWYTQDGNGENLILQSQTFENGYWVKVNSSVSTNATTAPDGTLTAEKLIDNTVNDAHYIVSSTVSITGSLTYTYSFYVKAAEITAGAAALYSDVPPYDSNLGISFNLTTGTVTPNPAGAGVILSTGISNVGSGWYRIWCTGLTNRTNIHRFNISLGAYLGTGTQGFFIWGAQLSQSNWLQGYQATTTAQVFRRDASQSTAANQPRIVGGGVIERENGKPTLFFDGVNDHFVGTDIALPTWSIFATAVRKIINADGVNTMYTRGSAINGSRDVLFTLINSTKTVNAQRSDNVIYSTSSAYTDIQNYLIASGIFTGSQITAFADSIAGASTSTSITGSVNPVTLIGAGIETNVTKFYMGGEIGEIIVYNSDRTATRADIERNLGAYYQTQWTGASSGLLDQFGGAAAAYSLRNLSSSYRGPLIRVRRSSDNAETDIGGTFSGDLDVNSLLAFTGGQNLFTNSQDYTQSNWGKSFVLAGVSATFAPDGTFTAQKINETAVTGFHVLYTDLSASAIPMTISCYVKAAERTLVSVQAFDTAGGSSYNVTVNLITGSAISQNTSGAAVYISHSVTNAGNGWWRISVSGNTRTAATNRYQIVLFDNSGQSSYLGVAGSGIYLWGAQLTTGSVLQPYIPTTTAAINGANAFVTRWYDQSGIGDNLLLQSQTFENASWGKFNATITQDTITAPDGTLTADKISETAVSGQHGLVQLYNIPASSIYTFSFYVKSAERSNVNLVIYFNGGATDNYVTRFNLLTGTVNSTSTGGAGVLISSSIQPAGEGWYRCSITGNTTMTGSHSIQLGILDSSFNSTYVGVAGSGVYIWGAQLSLGSELLRYQPTTTAAAPKRDAIQTTAASQPRIVNAGSVESENGKPAIYSNANAMTFPSIALNNFTVLWVSRKETELPTGSIILNDSITNISYMGDDVDLLGNPGAYSSNNIISRTTNNNSINGLETTYHIAYLNRRNSTQAVGQFNNSENLYNNAVANTVFNINSIGNYTTSPNYNYVGDLQEILIYSDDRSANRSPISSNLNSYYQIYWQGNGTALLDSFSGASAAYSLRNLSSAYTGPLIRVRRSSDNAERDIYGTFRGDLDLAALTSFVGANSGFVTTWYDQSGTGRHATQATAGSQPRIVNAGAVETENGKPAIVAVASGASFIVTAPVLDVSFTWFTVHKSPSTARLPYWINSSTNYIQLVDFDASVSADSSYIRFGASEVYQYSTGVSLVNQLRSFTMSSTNLFNDYRNSVQVYARQGGSSIITDGMQLQFGYLTSTGNVYQEAVFYATDRSTARTAIESNINNYYKIY